MNFFFFFSLMVPVEPTSAALQPIGVPSLLRVVVHLRIAEACIRQGLFFVTKQICLHQSEVQFFFVLFFLARPHKMRLMLLTDTNPCLEL